MERSELVARLVALHKAVSRLIERPQARYFDPPVALELFTRWAPIRDSLKLELASLLVDLPTRALPAPSGTTDYEGRGYVERAPIQQLFNDMQYVLDALAALPTVAVPSMKVTREGVFFAGQYFDALREVSELIGSAQRQLALIDGYVSPDTLAILSSRRSGTRIEILTKDASASLQVAAHAFVKQFGPLEIRVSQAFHDRFLIIDDADVYHFGASIKDLGHRGFMFSRVEEPEVLGALRAKFQQEWSGATVVL